MTLISCEIILVLHLMGFFSSLATQPKSKSQMASETIWNKERFLCLVRMVFFILWVTYSYGGSISSQTHCLLLFLPVPLSVKSTTCREMLKKRKWVSFLIIPGQVWAAISTTKLPLGQLRVENSSFDTESLYPFQWQQGKRQAIGNS